MPQNLDLPINYADSHWAIRKQAREQYVRQQNGKCCHCGNPLIKPAEEADHIDWDLFPEGFRKWPIHLHHDHNTGLTIGAVHMYCNAWLWQYRRE